MFVYSQQTHWYTPVHTYVCCVCSAHVTIKRIDDLLQVIKVRMQFMNEQF